MLRDVRRKIWWALFNKDGIDELQAELLGHTASIQIMLHVAQMFVKPFISLYTFATYVDGTQACDAFHSQRHPRDPTVYDASERRLAAGKIFTLSAVFCLLSLCPRHPMFPATSPVAQPCDPEVVDAGFPGLWCPQDHLL